MSKELEIEFKNLLEKEEFIRMKTAFHLEECDFSIQHNHYLDTALFALKEAGSALRIREKNGEFTWTLKTPVKEGILETHQAVSEQEARNILSGKHFPDGVVKEAVEELRITADDLHHFGTLTTRRAETSYRGGLLVLDNSIYLGCEDFELEFEVTERSSGEKVFQELLAEYQISRRKTDNKIKRFYDEKLRRGAGR